MRIGDIVTIENRTAALRANGTPFSLNLWTEKVLYIAEKDGRIYNLGEAVRIDLTTTTRWHDRSFFMIQREPEIFSDNIWRYELY